MRTVPVSAVQRIVQTAVIKGLEDDIDWEKIEHFEITTEGEYVAVDNKGEMLKDVRFSIVAVRLKEGSKK